MFCPDKYIFFTNKLFQAAVPKFGDWDENDPSAGEGFTMIFTKAKVERDAGGPAHIPAFRNDPAPIPHKETKPPQGGSVEKQPSVSSSDVVL